MKILVILAHPSTQSFNRAIARAACDELGQNGHAVIFHDLYREKFDPVLPFGECRKGAKLPAAIGRHCREIREADGLVLVHPNWWGEPPAILKGWVDRVFRPGVAYDFPPGPEGAAGLPIELLTIKCALVFNTGDTPYEREKRVLGDPLQTIWRNTLAFCGVHNFHRKLYGVVVTSTAAQRKEWLDDVRQRVKRFFPRKPLAQASLIVLPPAPVVS